MWAGADPILVSGADHLLLGDIRLTSPVHASNQIQMFLWKCNNTINKPFVQIMQHKLMT